MIAVLSPAKTLDFEQEVSYKSTKPRLINKSGVLINELRERDESDIQDLMKISEKLASINKERYHAFKPTHNSKNAQPCVFAFKGDVYQGLEAESFSGEDVQFAQEHLRILSGLYGLLRPLDLIQPYRLEMGTKLAHNGYKNLYEFWGDTLSDLLQNDLKKQGDDLLLNLASNEYFKSIKHNNLKAKVIDVDFLDYKNGKYKVISFYAKRARGYMAQFMIKNKITNPQDLQGFDLNGYSYDEKDSNETKLVFKRG